MKSTTITPRKTDMPTTINELRESLYNTITGQAGWRSRKASEYPEDPRNSRSSDALHALADEVLSNTDLEPAIEQLGAVAHFSNGRYWPVEDANELIRRHGFLWPWAPSSPMTPTELLEALLGVEGGMPPWAESEVVEEEVAVDGKTYSAAIDETTWYRLKHLAKADRWTVKAEAAYYIERGMVAEGVPLAEIDAAYS